MPSTIERTDLRKPDSHDIAAAALTFEHSNDSTTTASTATPVLTARRRRRAVLGAVAAVALATLGIAGVAGAAPPEPNPLLQCNPIACAAAYIGVPASDLSSAAQAESRRTGLGGMTIVIEKLDAAEKDRLSATGPTVGPMQALARYSIVATHDALRDLLLAYAVGTVVSPPRAP